MPSQHALVDLQFISARLYHHATWCIAWTVIDLHASLSGFSTEHSLHSVRKRCTGRSAQLPGIRNVSDQRQHLPAAVLRPQFYPP